MSRNYTDHPECFPQMAETDPAYQDHLSNARRPKPHACSLCGASPCESPSACAAQARFEDDPGCAEHYTEFDEEMDDAKS